MTLERFSRQILVDEIGYDGQGRLLQASVTVTGPEWMRSLTMRYLAAAGITVQDGGEAPELKVIGPRGEIGQATGAGSVGQRMASVGLLVCRVLKTLAEDPV